MLFSRSPFDSPDLHRLVRWNEMKIVRSFKNDPHSSIVPFHSFIITPSYALITMSVFVFVLALLVQLIRVTRAYLPTLVPVEVSESRAKKWFKSLLSGVHFLHSRGVVHNDIKYVHTILVVIQCNSQHSSPRPANILLSPANIPVLVDFGFAEKYDLSSPKAFHSNLTYGTPEVRHLSSALSTSHERSSSISPLSVLVDSLMTPGNPTFGLSA